MSSEAPAWVTPVMRAGYAARGLTYAAVGGLSLLSALRGGSGEGTQNALNSLKAHPLGTPLLWLIGLGLVCYAIWRLIDAALDLEDEGTDGKGLIARTGQAVTGLIHGALGLSVLGLGMGGGGGSGGSGSGAENWTQKVMSLPYGRWLVALAGLIVIGAGIYYARKGLTEAYKEDIRVTATTQKLDPALKFGLLAEGAVIGIIGGFLLYAGITVSPEQAGGVGQAFDWLRGLPGGRWLVAALALGLLGFALENIVEAIYRVPPRRTGVSVETLASRAKAEAERAVN